MRSVLVLGLGLSGVSAVRWLLARQVRVAVYADSDMNTVFSQLQSMGEISKYTPSVHGLANAGFDGLVVSPGVPLTHPIVQQAQAVGIALYNDIALFLRHRPVSSKLVAITGTNGKSTVTSLVGLMCQAAGWRTVVAGNIGIPVLDTLSLETSPDVYVLELSSFQLELIENLGADVATVLNVSADHLDRHGNLENYVQAKARIFEQVACQVINRDDVYSAAMVQHVPQLSFGLTLPHGEEAYGVSDDGAYLCRGKHKLLAIAQLKIQGQHQIANALASLAVCHALNLADAPCLSALSTFDGLPHRVSLVAEVQGVLYYDDSKGTNVGASVAALQGMTCPVILIAGGEGKGQDFSPLCEVVGRHARAAVLLGKASAMLEKALLPADIPLYHATTMQEAVRISHQLAHNGDAVLLSPACASTDMFRDYAHRAEVFVEAVHALLAEPTVHALKEV